MRVDKITICNFRSYYQTTVFDINEGMTLIIGDNGDGKTTLFEALEWLFDTTLKCRDEEKLISRMRLSQMLPGESDMVRVSIDFEHNGLHTLERQFSFAVSESGDVSTSSFCYSLYSQEGGERIKKDGKWFEHLFDTAIRKYSLFKGESELNIFNQKDTVNLLIETFSELKNFDPYVNFTEYAQRNAERALDNALASDKKNSKLLGSLNMDISNEREAISQLETELRTKRKEATNFTTLLENIEKNKESSALLKSVNDRLQHLKEKREAKVRKVREDYTIRLLDDMWILCGFAPVAREYIYKTSQLSKESRRQEAHFMKELGAKQAIQNVQQMLANGATPLPIYVPNEQTMREMLNDHICKICNRPAPEGSEAYEFMEKRLNDYLQSLSLKENDDNEEQCLFKYHYIKELDKRGDMLHNEMDYLTKLPSVIADDIDFNNRNKHDILVIDSNIAAAEEEKKRILANADGLDENALTAAYSDISNWWSLKSEAEKRILLVEGELKRHREALAELESKKEQIAMKSAAASYGLSSLALKKINAAFNAAKLQNKRDFLNQLEQYANSYIERLNTEDFTGVIKLIEMPDGSAVIELRDVNGTRILNPNTALKTTMYMSVLFAVSDLTTLKRDNDYPLIFDAPTSSFASAKEIDFFDVISHLKKQTIIVTKSFLREENGINVLDTERLRNISGNVYRIEKKRPFNNLDLATIQTVTRKIK